MTVKFSILFISLQEYKHESGDVIQSYTQTGTKEQSTFFIELKPP